MTDIFTYTHSHAHWIGFQDGAGRDVGGIGGHAGVLHPLPAFLRPVRAFCFVCVCVCFCTLPFLYDDLGWTCKAERASYVLWLRTD
jgi:hypothetical protein